MKKTEELLKKCVAAFNEIPNKKLKNGTDTYQIASEIDQLLPVLKKLDDDNTLVMVILNLMGYKEQYKPSQNGYIDITKLIEELEELRKNG